MALISAEVVAEFELIIREAHPAPVYDRADAPGDATEAAMQRQELEGDHEADERDRQDAEAALTQGDEPADPGLAATQSRLDDGGE